MRILVATLKAAGYFVFRRTGAGRNQKVKAQKPHLVLTDLSMPKMSGGRSDRHLKSDPEDRRHSVVAVTAYVWDGLAQSGRAGRLRRVHSPSRQHKAPAARES